MQKPSKTGSAHTHPKPIQVRPPLPGLGSMGIVGPIATSDKPLDDHAPDSTCHRILAREIIPGTLDSQLNSTTESSPDSTPDSVHRDTVLPLKTNCRGDDYERDCFNHQAGNEEVKKRRRQG